MVDERDSGAPLKRTFVVWSWISLLAAYVYTTVSFGGLLVAAGFASFATRLPPSVGRGRDADPLLRFISLLGMIVPIVILALACFVFLRYSVATYRLAVLDPPQEGDGEGLLLLFRGSLLWLIVVWIVALSMRALPLVLNSPFQ
jgi:hypothetical protein